MLLFLAVHLAVIGHASHIAQVAAERGAHIAASANGSVAGINNASVQASIVARDLGAQLGSAPVVQWNGRAVAVTVHVVTQKLVPFLPNEIHRTVWVAEETFVREQDR